jgi:two-component system, LytTR family, sensor kinase
MDTDYALFSYDDESSNELNLQLRYMLSGLVVACIATGFSSLFSSRFSIELFLNWLLFSTVITLCINNAVRFTRRFMPLSRNNSWWKVALVFYPLLIAATVLGVLISYAILYMVYGNRIITIHNFSGGLLISVCVSVVVGTVIFINTLKNTTAKLQLEEQSLELAKLEQLKTAAELASLQARINPHFLYNALNAIAALIHDEPDTAEDMTINLAKLFRYSINTQNENYATIREELDILNAYLTIEKTRFGNKLNFSIKIHSDLYPQKIPRFLIQPLVENAVKHGLSPLATSGFIEVSIEKCSETNLKITIHDNGVPFPATIQQGFGIKSTFDKLRLLYGQNNYSVAITNEPVKQIAITTPLS